MLTSSLLSSTQYMCEWEWQKKKLKTPQPGAVTCSHSWPDALYYGTCICVIVCVCADLASDHWDLMSRHWQCRPGVTLQWELVGAHYVALCHTHTDTQSPPFCSGSWANDWRWHRQRGEVLQNRGEMEQGENLKTVIQGNLLPLRKYIHI